MLIRPQPAAGVDTIGKRFAGTFTIPTELSFNHTLRVRAYFEDYRPDLSPASYHDYVGEPYVRVDGQAANVLHVDIKSRKKIHALHLMNINYRGISKLKGQAVPISGVVSPPRALACRQEPVVPAATAALMVAEILPTRAGIVAGLPPLVNLLVYNRDLGVATASHGVVKLSYNCDAHNVPNGNMFFQVSLLDTSGHGENLHLRLTYNSLQASYQDSLELFQDLNGLTDDDLFDNYCPNPLGKGWTHSYNIYLRDYVRPLDDDGKILDPFLELACPDGNRIQFKRAPWVGRNAFVPEFLSDHWLGDAELGHTLRLRRQKDVLDQDEYLLENRFGDTWRFDQNRRLTTIAPRWLQGSVVEPLSVRHQGATVEITDSRSRQVSIASIPPARGQTGTVSIFDLDQNEIKLTYAHGHLSKIDRLSIQKWEFAYHEDIGQKGAQARCSLLKSLTDPTSIITEYAYYTDAAFEGVPAATAARFWGCLGSASRSSGDDQRKNIWLYRPYDGARQRVIHRNAEGVEFEITTSRKEMAVAAVAYVKQQRDAKTSALTGQPKYDPANDPNSAALPLKRIMEIEYYKGSKLPAKSLDFQSNVSTVEYKEFRTGTMFLVDRVTKADGTILKYEYYDDDKFNLLRKIHNPRPGPLFVERYAELVYDDHGLLAEKKFPTLDDAPFTEKWKYHPSKRQLIAHTDLRKTEWTFGYGDQKRDPDNTGLATSKSVVKQLVVKNPGDPKTQTLEWQFTYNRLGQLKRTYEPLFGEIQDYDYHKLGPVNKITLQPIPVAKPNSAVAGMDIVTTYTPSLLLESRTSAVSTEEWKYNNHGELVRHTNPVQAVATRNYFKTGALKSTTNGLAVQTEYVRDELGRVIRVSYPIPDVRDADKRSPAFIDVLEYGDDTAVNIFNRYEVSDTTRPTREYVVAATDLKFQIKETFAKGYLSEQISRMMPAGKETKRTYHFDEWGHQHKVVDWDSTQERRSTTSVLDNWGREVATVEEDQQGTTKISRRYGHPLDALGAASGIVPPAISTIDGVSPSWAFTRDEFGRVTAVKDSYGITVSKIEYGDFGNFTEDAQELARRLR